jgi:peptide/nickel transport system ATP-binding protein
LTDAVLEVRDLRVAFPTPRGLLRAVQGVSFDLARGETLGVVGESGSGKSVTALSLIRLLPPRAQVSGSVLYNGNDLVRMKEGDLRLVRGRHVAMVFQDPMSSLNPVRTIGVQIEESLRLHLGLGRRAARARAGDLLAQVGIPAPARQLDAYPHQFSGGMRQRVMIAMALSCEPQVILADEPTTALDVSVQSQILDLLRSVTAERGTALVLISHDLSVVAGLADRVAVMYAGEIVELGPSERVFERPRHPYTRGLLECVPRLDEARSERLASIEGSPPDLTLAVEACPFAPRCAFASRGLRERPRLGEKGPAHLAACFEEIPPPEPRGGTLAAPQLEAPDAAGVEAPVVVEPPAPGDREHALVVRELEVHFGAGGLAFLRRGAGPVRAVDGVTFQVARGETLGLVGESGSGKSTTARAIVQLNRPTGGEVFLGGERISALPERELRRVKTRLQMVFQDPYSSLNPRMTVGAIVREPLVVNDAAPRSRVRGRVRELLEQVGLPDYFADRYPHELSGGQRQRVSIARALALGPACVVADEPTSALDVSVRAQILNLLQDLQAQEGLTYLFISHDLSVVRHMSDHVAVMYLGKIVEVADRDTLYRSPQHPYTQALLSVIPIPDPKVEKGRRHVALRGEIPSPSDPPRGCNFNTRCPYAFDRCFVEEPPLYKTAATQFSACFLAEAG